MSDNVKVSVNHLTKKFGDLLVLNDVSFEVMDGDLLCVVGPTGCGKTTFLNSLVNIYQITSGEILLDGKQVNTKEQNIAYIFQGDSTMPWLTVEENVRFGLNLKKISSGEKKKKIHPIIVIQTLLSIISLIFIFTTPGNFIRQNTEIIIPSSFQQVCFKGLVLPGPLRQNRNFYLWMSPMDS